MINRFAPLVIGLLVLLSGVQVGTDFDYHFSDSLTLGLDSSSVLEINGLTAGIDLPRLPMVAGVSISRRSWFSIFNILKR